MPVMFHCPAALTEPGRAFLRALAASCADAPGDHAVFVCFDLAGLASLLPQFPQPAPLLVVRNQQAFFAHIDGPAPCPVCLYHWLGVSQSHRPDQPETPDSPAVTILGSFLLQCCTSTPSPSISIEALDYATGHVTRHPVFPRRNCPRCGPGDPPPGLPLRVHCSPVTGIVKSVELSNAPSAGAYRALAVWNSPPPIAGARPRLHRQAAYGRGRTAEQALDGAVGEALERYSLIYRGDESLTRAPAAGLGIILHPDSIQLYSDRQYAERARWQAEPDEIFHIPEPFDPSVPIDWIPATDLHGAAPRLAPAALCLMWYQFHPGEPRFASADTIGCGSGRTFDDALVHALLEWIERDAMALWWYNRAHRPAVRLEAFGDPDLLAAREALRAIGRGLYLLDCTTDLGLPTYISVAPRHDGTEILFAGAAHPSPRVAAWKAASEVAQVWTTAQTTGRLPESLRPWLTRETLDAHPYLAPWGEIEPLPEPPPLDAAAQLRLILDRLESAGLRAYSVDHSRPDVLLRTVRALVPGLRHIWNRRGPGRLYEVPPRLGWVPAPLTEEELNPICCMI